MLLSCLETETSSFNLRYLLHLIEVYVYEDVAFCPGLVGVVVKTIQEKVQLKHGPDFGFHVSPCPQLYPSII